MRKLISIGIIIVVLATMLAVVPTGARIIVPPSPSRLFSEMSVDYYAGVQIYGGVIAYETPYREVKLSILVEPRDWSHYVNHVELIVAMWYGTDPNNVVYKTYASQQAITPDVGPQIFTLSVKEEDGATTHPNWGFAYLRVAGWGISQSFKVYSIRFINSSTPPVINEMPALRILTLEDMYKIFCLMDDIWP